MDTRTAAVIAEAQGVLMARYGFDRRQATLWLLSQAEDLSLSVEHVAEGLVAEVRLRGRTT